MKLTKLELRRLIKEELGAMRQEQSINEIEAEDIGGGVTGNFRSFQVEAMNTTNRLLQQILMAIRAGPRQE